MTLWLGYQGKENTEKERAEGDKGKMDWKKKIIDYWGVTKKENGQSTAKLLCANYNLQAGV